MKIHTSPPSFITSVSALLALTLTAQAQFLDNPSFETDNVVSGDDWNLVYGGQALATYGDWTPDIGSISAQEGSTVAFFLGATNSVGLSAVEQPTNLFVSENTTYELSGWFVNPQRGAGAYGGEMLRIVARNPDGPGAHVIGMHFLEASDNTPSLAGPLVWTERTASVTIGSSVDSADSLNGVDGSSFATVDVSDILGWQIFATVGKSMTTTGNSFGFNAQTYADNISLVPEPSAFALLSGLMALGFLQLRRSRSSSL